MKALMFIYLRSVGLSCPITPDDSFSVIIPYFFINTAILCYNEYLVNTIYTIILYMNTNHNFRLDTFYSTCTRSTTVFH